jgi:hypothetical protein
MASVSVDEMQDSGVAGGAAAFDGLVTFYHDSAGSESAKWTSFVRNEDQIDRGLGG